MSDVENETLAPPLAAAVAEFGEWWTARLRALDDAESVQAPLYHYTDANGLIGILNDQEVWFTSAFHLNDPSELSFGLEVASEVLLERAGTVEGPARAFCEVTASGLTTKIKEVLAFFIVGFSRAANDLGQWRAYADNGRGFAIGFAPRLFHAEDKTDPEPNEVAYIGSVKYDRSAVKASLEEVLDRAISLILREVHAGNIASVSQGKLFLQNFSTGLSIPTLFYALTAKDEAYLHEQETRLIMMDLVERLSEHVEVRARGSALVPFVRHAMPLREAGSIAEVVIGPSAHPGAEDAIRSLLASHGLSDVPVWRSKIPYRAH